MATTTQEMRQTWMAVLARASRAELEYRVAAVAALPSYEMMTPASIGTVMVEGRAGGTGARFNLGEATMTKAVVRLDDGTMGFAYALGRDTQKAVLCAVLDAVLQSESRHGELMHAVIEPLADAQRRRRLDASRKAAATKVEFFTLQRGDG
jgi:alpha-D-ribose 1-methylphosphonate 5-triphosphate synthase subunit PhnG